ncbi:MAG: hypothetical protein M0R17_02865 [Candidatus Omnitrophica bacterium]|jgi:hypothetical protein|nr:hypothetical protein [Candidatus Omnitrophota bacterium]
MKIRNGFVSNSSSSSFVIRGTKVNTDECIKLFNIDTSDEDCYNLNKPTDKDAFVQDRLYSKLSKDGLEIETIRSYFDGEEAGEIIIGIDISNENDGLDGVVVELDELDDNQIKEKLAKYNIHPKQLRTYIQYISNDNY